jgi:hypothetical protein
MPGSIAMGPPPPQSRGPALTFVLTFMSGSFVSDVDVAAIARAGFNLRLDLHVDLLLLD